MSFRQKYRLAVAENETRAAAELAAERKALRRDSSHRVVWKHSNAVAFYGTLPACDYFAVGYMHRLRIERNPEFGEEPRP